MNQANTVLFYLEKCEAIHPNKEAVIEGNLSLTYSELMITAQKIGSAISKYENPGKPIPLLMEKSCMTLAAMFGIVYAGCFYVPVNPSQPVERIKKILGTLKAETIITDSENLPKLDEADFSGKALLLEELSQGEIDSPRLLKIRQNTKETDLLYGIFTSGSTGNPKGIVVSHQAVIKFIDHFTELFSITGKDVIGNQAPFDFDVSVKDIYSSIATGATLVLIPKELFSMPPRLMDYLCENKITTLIWAVSALCIISSMKVLKYRIPLDVNKVMFSGEVMPVKQLNIWQNALPHASFINLYGPSEITCNCTFYIIDKHFNEDQRLPIGKKFPGREVFLLDENNKIITSPKQKGEICVAGESLAEGYYNNPEETKKRFTSYSLDGQQQRIYHTGDLGYFNKDGVLFFSGRKDFQIKHMGHRIELEEIESIVMAIQEVTNVCCVFDMKKNRILAFYVGDAESSQMRRDIKLRLPPYMVPSKIIKIDKMPLTKNGKRDRSRLLEMIGEK